MGQERRKALEATEPEHIGSLSSSFELLTMGLDLTEYEKMTWKTPSDELEDAIDDLITEVKWLREKISEICDYFHHTILEADGFMDLMYELDMFEEEEDTDHGN